MTLGEKIYQQRKAQGLSQEQLAAKIQVSRQAISKWELDEALPGIDNIIQLSKAFDISTDYLLHDDFVGQPEALVTNSTVSLPRKTSRKALPPLFVLGIGLLGLLIFWILSSAIPATKMVPDFRGAPVSIDSKPLSEQEIAKKAAEGEVYFYTDIEVRGELLPFLDTYKLWGIFALCCTLILTGGLWLLILRQREKRAHHKS